MNSTPLAALIAEAVDAGLVEARTGIPARVVAYDAATRRADVQPLIRRTAVDEDGVRQTSDDPVIPDVPVAFPGSGSARIKFPISVGDEVWLTFAHASLDKYKARLGGSGPSRTIDPEDTRHHHIADAIVWPMMQTAADDASTLIEFTSTEIRAGGSAALATKADIDALISAFNAHTHTVPITGAAGTTSSTAPLVAAGSAAGTAVLKGS